LHCSHFLLSIPAVASCCRFLLSHLAHLESVAHRGSALKLPRLARSLSFSLSGRRRLFNFMANPMARSMARRDAAQSRPDVKLDRGIQLFAVNLRFHAVASHLFPSQCLKTNTAIDRHAGENSMNGVRLCSLYSAGRIKSGLNFSGKFHDR
jgi:hypothetical protein